MRSDFDLQTAIGGATNALTAQLTAMAANNASCCCDLKTLIASEGCDTRRAIADSTRDIIDSNNAGVRAILDFLTQDKIASLTTENQNLKFAASQAAQNNYLIAALREPAPVPAYVVANPNGCGNVCAF